MNNLASDLKAVLSLKSGVERLTLTDYRNYSSLRINAELSPIVVYGDNGAGKTNILEAISFYPPEGVCAPVNCLTLKDLSRR